MTKRLSIIIVTYKSENDIYDCIKSVWRHCDIIPSELEVIIVDNSPDSEPMFSKLRTLFNNDIVLIHNTHNGGYGQGNNIGINHAKSPVVMIMNPDVRLIEPIFSTVLKEFDNNENLLMYGMKQMTSTMQASTNSFCCTSRMNGYLASTLNAICTRREWYIPYLMYLQGSCFFIHKEKFQSIDMFNERHFMYGEEDDIHYRMTKKYGFHIKYNHKLRYIHLVGNRKPNIDYQKKRLDASVFLNKSIGYKPEKTIRNYKQTYRLLIAREWLRLKLHKGSSEFLRMAIEFYHYLQNYNK